MAVGLIGYRGSGKSTAGLRLAGRLEKPFIDTDQRIVARAGKTIRDIFADQGEAAFRDLETQVVAEACEQKEGVIALGGGALDREENRRVIESSGIKLVYLRCEPAELLRRIRNDVNTAAARPNLTSLGGGIEEIQAVLARREPIWRTMMAAEIDVTLLSPLDVELRLLQLPGLLTA